MDDHVPSKEIITKIVQLPATRMIAFAVGATACGVAAIAALAVGKLAVGRLTVRKSKFAKVEIGDLVVRRLTVLELGSDSVKSELAAPVASAAAANTTRTKRDALLFVGDRLTPASHQEKLR